MYESVFSKFELRRFGVKIAGEETYTSADCVGTFEEELDVIVVSKKCRGVEVKKRPRGAGTGTVTASLHIPYGLYAKMFDMEREDLAQGVQGYGKMNYHKEFSVVADVFDEDGKELLLAYPRAIIATGPNTNIENGAEEVAEVEVEISVMPDDYGYCRYETVVSDLADDGNIASTWMTAFTPELVQKTV